MYKYSKKTNQFIQMPDLPNDAIDVTDEVVEQARAAFAQGLPFVVLDESTISVSPSAKHHFEADVGEWHYWPYVYSVSQNSFYPSDMLDVYDLPDDVINVDAAVFDAASAARLSGLAFVILGSTAISVSPSAAHDWSAKTNDWVLNKTRAAALEAQAIKDAVPKIVSMVQAKCALLRFGLLDDVEAAMLTDAVPREAKIYWTGTTVRREDATVAMMAAMLKLTDAQVDDLFTLAATL